MHLTFKFLYKTMNKPVTIVILTFQTNENE